MNSASTGGETPLIPPPPPPKPSPPASPVPLPAPMLLDTFLETLLPGHYGEEEMLDEEVEVEEEEPGAGGLLMHALACGASRGV